MNTIDDVRDVHEHFAVRKMDHSNSCGFQSGVACVALWSEIAIMNGTVDLDREPNFGAVEIDNEISDPMLSSELE